MFAQTVFCLPFPHFENHPILEPVCAIVLFFVDFLVEIHTVTSKSAKRSVRKISQSLILPMW